MTVVAGTGIRGKAEMQAREVLEAEQVADECAGNVLDMNAAEICIWVGKPSQVNLKAHLCSTSGGSLLSASVLFPLYIVTW